MASYSLSQFTSFLPLSFDLHSKVLKSPDSDTTTVFLVLLTLKVFQAQTQWSLLWLFPRLIRSHIFPVSFKHKDSQIKHHNNSLTRLAVKFSVCLKGLTRLVFLCQMRWPCIVSLTLFSHSTQTVTPAL